MNVDRKTGFTLIELTFVFSLVMFLIVIVYAGINFLGAKTRDAVRINDLANLSKALVEHHTQFGHWVEKGFGQWDGNGFIAIPAKNGGNPSVLDRLLMTNFIFASINDPLGSRGAEGTHPGYMKYHCPADEPPTHVYLYARLETRPLTNEATDNTCCPDCDLKYGMNYYRLVSPN